MSPVLDNQAFAIDAFSLNWNSHAYAFPPAILIPSVLNKIRQSQCRIILIHVVPLWPQQTWFSEVIHLLVSAPVCLPLFPNLLTQAKEVSTSKTSQYSTFTPGSYQAVRDKKNFAKGYRFCLQIKTNINSDGAYISVGVIEGRLKKRSRPLLLL